MTFLRRQRYRLGVLNAERSRSDFRRKSTRICALRFLVLLWYKLSRYAEMSPRSMQFPPRHVDALLLDSGKIDGQVKELAGTGRVHDWTLSRRIRDAVSIPLLLAGGLHAGNVAAAMAVVRPFGLDVCSGVRTNGVLDPEKLDAFFAAIGN